MLAVLLFSGLWCYTHSASRNIVENAARFEQAALTLAQDEHAGEHLERALCQGEPDMRGAYRCHVTDDTGFANYPYECREVDGGASMFCEEVR